jgi:serine/threonine protein kinase
VNVPHRRLEFRRVSGFANSLIGVALGGYTIQRMIARGGMGIVYEGIQESLGRRVAVKVLYPHLGEDESFRDRFQREARAIAQLRHRNIVGIIDFGTHDGLHYMVMDLIDGPSLRDELARRHDQGQPFTTDESLAIIEKIAAALAYAHGRGFVHRDVKPANVMLDEHGEVYLTDFGLVRLADAQGMTMTGAIVGTPEYMAPEQSLGTGEISAAADQYALAVVAYQLFVGRVPFKAPTPVGVIQKHISEPPPPPHTILPWFPPGLERVLMRGLAKDPQARYPSVAAFFQELRQAASGLGMSPVVLPVAADQPDTGPTAPTRSTDESEHLVPPQVSSASMPPSASVSAPAVTPASVPVVGTPRHDPEQLTAPVPVVTTTRPSPPTLSGPVGVGAIGGTGADGTTRSLPTAPVAPSDGGSMAPPPATPYPVPAGAAGGGRKPLVAVLIALALLLLLGGMSYAMFLRGDDSPAHTPVAGVIATNTAEVELTATPDEPEATPTDDVVPSPTPQDVAPTATLEPEMTPTSTPTTAPSPTSAETPTPIQIRPRPDTPTPFSINPVRPTPTPVPPPLGDVTGPAATVEMRNYLSVPTVLYLVGAGSVTLQPGEFLTRPMPAGTWNYVQSAQGYAPLEGETTWEADGSYVWEFYDPQEVEIVEIVNNFAVPITLEFDGYGPVTIEPYSSRTRVFPAREYEYTFTAEGYQSRTSTVVMEAGQRTTWPWSPA